MRQRPPESAWPAHLREFRPEAWPLDADDLAAAAADATEAEAAWWRRVFAYRRYQLARRLYLRERGPDFCREHGLLLLSEFRAFPPGEEPGRGTLEEIQT